MFIFLFVSKANMNTIPIPQIKYYLNPVTNVNQERDQGNPEIVSDLRGYAEKASIQSKLIELINKASRELSFYRRNIQSKTRESLFQ